MPTEGAFRVLLEPDGLKFIMPATLTITGDGSEQGVFTVLTKTENPEFILTQQLDGEMEGKISHFSSAIVDQNPNLWALRIRRCWIIAKSYPESKNCLRTTIKSPNLQRLTLNVMTMIPMRWLENTKRNYQR